MRFRFAALAAFAMLFATPAAAEYNVRVRILLPSVPVDQLIVTARIGETETVRKIDKPGREAVTAFTGEATLPPGTELTISILPMEGGYQTADVQCRRYRGHVTARVITITCVDDTDFKATEAEAEPSPPPPPPPSPPPPPPPPAPPPPTPAPEPIMPAGPAPAAPVSAPSGGGSAGRAGGVLGATAGSVAPPRRYRPPAGMKPAGGSGPAATAPSNLPGFQWPPPAPSERMNLQRARLAAGLPAKASLLDLANKMTGALNGAGYSEYSFFSVPNGFALVARLEQFNPDGSPKPQGLRFLDPDAAAPFSLAAYVKQLFFAPEGYYRLIVFVVTNQAFAASGPSPTAARAEAWLRNGANTLPQQYATLAFSPGHQVTALIYEFRKHGNAPIATLDPGQLDANTHLMKAGLLERLLGR